MQEGNTFRPAKWQHELLPASLLMVMIVVSLLTCSVGLYQYKKLHVLSELNDIQLNIWRDIVRRTNYLHARAEFDSLDESIVQDIVFFISELNDDGKKQEKIFKTALDSTSLKIGMRLLNNEKFQQISQLTIKPHIWKKVEDVVNAPLSVFRTGYATWDTSTTIDFRNEALLIPLTNRGNLISDLKSRWLSKVFTLLFCSLSLSLAGIWVVSTCIISPTFRSLKKFKLIAKQKSESSRLATEQLEKTLAIASEGVIITDEHGHITTMNSAAEKITGWDVSDSLTQHLSTVCRIARIESDSTIVDLFELPKESAATGQVEHLLISWNGTERHVIIHSALIPQQNQHEAGLVLTLRDITRESFREEQALQSNHLSALCQLVAGVSHDINNMLANISGNAEVAQLENSETMSTGLKGRLSHITNTCTRLADLNSKLSTFASQENSIDSRHVFSDSINQSLTLCRTAISPDIHVQFQNNADGMAIFGNKSTLQSVILNLLLNASNSIESAGEISITLNVRTLNQQECDQIGFEIEPGDWLELIIADNGKGINAANLKHVFKPDYGRKISELNSMPGLANVHNTVVQHKGAILVASKLNKGTTVTIYLKAQEPVQLTPFQQENPTGKIGNVLNILLVEDEKELRELTSKLINTLGHKVTVAENGAVAIEKVESSEDKFDLAIVDLIMPVMDGVQTIEELKKIDPKCAVILATGFTRTELSHKNIDLDVLAVIKKPFKMSHLKDALNAFPDSTSEAA